MNALNRQQRGQLFGRSLYQHPRSCAARISSTPSVFLSADSGLAPCCWPITQAIIWNGWGIITIWCKVAAFETIRLYFIGARLPSCRYVYSRQY